MNHVWVWRSFDGPIIFSSRRKAMERVEGLYPGGRWTRDADGDLEYHHERLGNEDDDDAYGEGCFVVREPVN